MSLVEGRGAVHGTEYRMWAGLARPDDVLEEALAAVVDSCERLIGARSE